MQPSASITRASAQALDRITAEKFGIPTRVLMENAGREVASAVLGRLRALKVSRAVREGMAARVNDEESDGGFQPPKTVDELAAWQASLKQVDGPVGVVCGGGNNGGDGLVAARTLVNQGVEVITLLVGSNPSLLKGDCRENFRALSALQPEIHVVEGMDHVDPVFARLESCLIVVDALFGIGLNRPLEGVHYRAVQRINELDKPTVSVDIPSGLDADTGAVHGTAVLADMTMTFGAAKRGMTRGHGPDHCGRIEVAEVGFPRQLIEKALLGQI